MSATKLTLSPNGSIKVEGDFELLDHNGQAYGLGGRTTVFLCRCGLSSTKPFCDGSHKGKFNHTQDAYNLPDKK